MAKDAKWYACWVRLANAKSAEEKLTNLETAEFIENLAAELEAVKRERDAAVRDMTYATKCESCKHYYVDIGGIPCNMCAVVHKGAGIMWEWRGLCSENGGITDD